MKTQIALLTSVAALVAAFGLLSASPAYVEQSITDTLTASLRGVEAVAPAIVLAQAYGGASRGSRLWNGVYGGSLGVNPDYGFYKIYGPDYDQTGGYYGSIGQHCRWNTLYPFCEDESDSY